MSEVDRSQFVLPNNTDVCLLDCNTAFHGLSDREKLYAHYLSQASWVGSLICLLQTSSESPGIFLLLQKLFRNQTVDELKDKALKQDLTDEEFQAVLVYTAGFYSNMGNYKSFGDTKFIPDLPQDKFEKLLHASRAYEADPEGIQTLWDRIKDKVFSLSPRQQQLGLGDKGVTTYFSDNCDITDAELVQQFLTEKDLSPYNTRLFKTVEDDQVTYDIRLASAHTSGQGEDDLAILGTHEFTPKNSSTSPVCIKVTRGDYAPLMQLMVDNLTKAKEYVANEHERNMLSEYIRSFGEGSIPAHKSGSKHWIINKGPIIETYIGFIESYRDPFGVRGEFEGFVAMVNREMSAKFGELVSKAEDFLPLLPWPPSYEKDKFLQPDFTSLDVLTFGSSGIPAGINIPNYDDIRQSTGFKNVSLGNVLASGYKDTKVTFLAEEDKELYSKLKIPSFEVQVGLHELLGHGSGKLFIKNADGGFNFDPESVTHTETNDKIKTWYNHNETWDTKFQTLSSSYEECRAECVGIYLSLYSDILRIFGHEDQAAEDIMYVNWLNMVRSGLLALEFCTPETQAWRQAHMHARFVILRVLLEAGENLVTISQVTGDDGEPDVIIKLDRSKLQTVGKEAIGNFLRKLQTYKATADYQSGKALFDRYSAVNDDTEPPFRTIRGTVLKRKQPRKLFVQCNTILEDGRVELKEYDGSPEGLVASNIARFPVTVDKILQELWDKDKPYFT